MSELTKILNNPEEHYPGNFDTPQRANALLTGLCQDAATEIERLNRVNAELVEACAKVCDDRAFQFRSESPFFVEMHGLADAIRARGETK
jgi:hypothetical protein